MLMLLRNMVFQLAEEKQLAFQDARGVHLECTEGVVWLTVEGQPGDFLLAKGERLRIDSNGLALVQGLPSGAVRLLSEAGCKISLENRFYWRFDPFAFFPRCARGLQ